MEPIVTVRLTTSQTTLLYAVPSDTFPMSLAILMGICSLGCCELEVKVKTPSEAWWLTLTSGEYHLID